MDNVVLEKLNGLAREICPNLKLEFMGWHGSPNIAATHILMESSAAFDSLEEFGSAMFKARIKEALLDMQAKIVISLKEIA